MRKILIELQIEGDTEEEYSDVCDELTVGDLFRPFGSMGHETLIDLGFEIIK